MTDENKTTIRLEGYIDVPTERLVDVMEALPEHMALTRSEAGCIEFYVTMDSDILGRLVVSEQFTDEKAFEYHQVRTQSSAWAKITDGIERHYTIMKQ